MYLGPNLKFNSDVNESMGLLFTEGDNQTVDDSVWGWSVRQQLGTDRSSDIQKDVGPDADILVVDNGQGYIPLGPSSTKGKTWVLVQNGRIMEKVIL